MEKINFKKTEVKSDAFKIEIMSVGKRNLKKSVFNSVQTRLHQTPQQVWGRYQKGGDE